MIRKIFNFIKQVVKWIQFKLRKKYKRKYEVYNSDAPEHIGLFMRGLPKAGSRVTIKGGTTDDKSRHYGVIVLSIIELTEEQRKTANLTKSQEAWYIDGKYNDLEIKRIE